MSTLLLIIRRFSTILNFALSVLSVLTLFFYLLYFGGDLPEWAEPLFPLFQEAVLTIFIVDMILQFVLSRPKSLYFRDHLIDWIILIPWIFTAELTYSVPLILVRQGLWTWRSFTATKTAVTLLADFRRYPAKMLAGSFFAVISMGTILLVFPIATYKTGGMGIIDALFTVTSATCVTGLTLYDTYSYFTPFGQGIILALIQIGGLGMMTLSSAVAVILGEKLTLRNRVLLQDILEETNVEDFKQLLITILRTTLTIELVGALVLTLRWKDELGSWGKSIYFGIFHAISAFCNAGFVLFPDNLMQFSSDGLTTFTVTTLIILGGIGFPVLAGLLHSRFWSRDLAKRRSISIHTKLVLMISLILLIAGATFLFFVEFSNAFANLDMSTRVQAAWFQSVTSRTAGFNTISLNALTQSSQFLLIVLMFIGASPGSTGGGIKTTTFGVLMLAFLAMLRGREDVECFGRRVPVSIINKSIAIAMSGCGVVTIGVLLLLMTEISYPLMTVLFEAVSAFGTVGLSLGLTPYLSDVGKILVSVLMFIGRVGPLTLAFIVGQQLSVAHYRYPYGKVMVG